MTLTQVRVGYRDRFRYRRPSWYHEHLAYRGLLGFKNVVAIPEHPGIANNIGVPVCTIVTDHLVSRTLV